MLYASWPAIASGGHGILLICRRIPGMKCVPSLTSLQLSDIAHW